jgi:hypothetical protein
LEQEFWEVQQECREVCRSTFMYSRDADAEARSCYGGLFVPVIRPT